MYTDSMFKRKHKDRSKSITSSVKWSKKNEVYLKHLGFLDPKGRSPKNISGLVNMAVTLLLEEGKNLGIGIMASKPELSHAFRKACVAERNRQISKLQQEIKQIIDWEGEA